jgi:hypothetical protein
VSRAIGSTSRRPSRGADRDRAPDEQEDRAAEEDEDRRRIEGDPEQPADRRAGQGDDDAEEHRQDRQPEQGGAPAAAGHEVAEPGKDRIEEGVEMARATPRRDGRRFTPGLGVHRRAG